MDQPADPVRTEHAERPQHEKDHDDRPQHWRPLPRSTCCNRGTTPRVQRIEMLEGERVVRTWDSAAPVRHRRPRDTTRRRRIDRAPAACTGRPVYVPWI